MIDKITLIDNFTEISAISFRLSTRDNDLVMWLGMHLKLKHIEQQFVLPEFICYKTPCINIVHFDEFLKIAFSKCYPKRLRIV